MILIEEAEYSASAALYTYDVWILSRCVKHESHPMNHDFKVEFNYSWLAPPVDDYLKVQKQKKKLKRFHSRLSSGGMGRRAAGCFGEERPARN